MCYRLVLQASAHSPLSSQRTRCGALVKSYSPLRSRAAFNTRHILPNMAEISPGERIPQSFQIGGDYRYAYAPLPLHALDHQVGNEAMRGFVRALLAAPASRIGPTARDRNQRGHRWGGSGQMDGCLRSRWHR